MGHGAHVAGIVHLAAPDAKILPIRVQDNDGGGWSFILAEAIVYAVDQGADVINVSLEVPCTSKVLEWAVDYASEHGVLLVASAGNNNSSEVSYPAAFASTIAVAAVDSTGSKANFSIFGAAVAISAVGVNIYCTFTHGRFAWWSGTSQASPVIAGEAALIRSKNPKWKINDIIDVIAPSTVETGPTNSKDDEDNYEDKGKDKGEDTNPRVAGILAAVKSEKPE